MQLSEGQIVAEHYKLLKQLGHGSFGDVWLAHNELADIDVAIKFYGTFDMKGLEEFRTEFKIAYKLRHPNLLNINHFDVYNNCPYLVMPYCANGSVSGQIGQMTEGDLWKFVLDVSAGLAYLHSQQPPIIHQDIKPDNILITSDGRYVISDFGISRNLRTKMSRNNTEVSSSGTIAYMGPERFSKQPVTVLASDVWAFGMTLYEIMTGNILWEGIGGCAQLNGARLPIIESNYSNELTRLVIACLAAETWNRPTAIQINEYASAMLQHRPLPQLPSTQERTVSTAAPVAAPIPQPRPAVSYTNNTPSSTASYHKAPSANSHHTQPAHKDDSQASLLPFGLSAKNVALIAGAIVVIALLAWGATAFISSVREEQRFVSCQTKEDYEEFINDYPSSSYAETARKRIADLSPVAPVTNMVEDGMENNSETNAGQINTTGTVIHTTKPQKPTPSPTSARPSSSDNGYSADDRAFYRCSSAKDYHNYLNNFPNGRHRRQAENALTNLINSQGGNKTIPTNRVTPSYDKRQKSPRMRPHSHRRPRW